MDRAPVVCLGDVILPEHLGLTPPPGPTPVGGEAEWLTRDEYERRYILRVLEKTGGAARGRQGAAASLGMPEPILRDRMKRLGIARPRVLPLRLRNPST
jgi:DNA-binding NtrC family response regulator